MFYRILKVSEYFWFNYIVKYDYCREYKQKECKGKYKPKLVRIAFIKRITLQPGSGGVCL